ncbi:MAG: hypothetical protein AAFV86_17955 [Pseudomonadota bacterium]
MRPMPALAPTVLTATLFAAAAAPAAAWDVPPRGSETRGALMDAIRPFAERDLGAPVQFIVETLRIEGRVGFATLRPVRPGGGPIAWAATPLAARGADPDAYNGSTVHVLYQRSGGDWMVADWSLGAGDVWWAAPELCAIWRAVIPEFCD